MIIKMILINPTWIFVVMFGVLKTILAISREIYYLVPSPGWHFMGQPATGWPVHHTACPPVHRNGQGQLPCTSSRGHTSQCQCNGSSLVVTRELEYQNETVAESLLVTTYHRWFNNQKWLDGLIWSHSTLTSVQTTKGAKNDTIKNWQRIICSQALQTSLREFHSHW